MPWGGGYPARFSWGVPISHNALQHYLECHGVGVPSQVQLGRYPYPIMLCNITQNSMGQTPGGVPGQVQLGGGVQCQVRMGGTQVRYPPGPGQDGGYPAWGGTQVGYPRPGQDGGYPTLVHPPAGYPLTDQDGGGYPVRTTEGALTTRRAVCLLRSRRRTFLLKLGCFDINANA